MKIKVIIFFLLAIQIGFLRANSLRVPGVFGDNMVIQRGLNSPVWGQATPNTTVYIQFAGAKISTSANSKGGWMTRLPKLKAGGPYQLKIYNLRDSVIFSNVLIGDVWLASGQSNMQMALSWGVNNKEEEINDANYPSIRLLNVEDDLNNKPQTDIPGGRWKECNPISVKDFSAIAYFFARQISKEMNVPIGIINSSWGGTDIQSWMSAEALETIPFYKDTLPKIIAQTGDFETGFERFKQQNKTRDSIISNSNEGFRLGVFKTYFDDKDWKEMTIPCKWSEYGLKNYYGFVWFRKHITLAENETKNDFQLNLGDVSTDAIAFFNGNEIQREGTGANVLFDVPSKFLKTGDNVISLRVMGAWGVGGFISPADLIYLKSSDSKFKKSLANHWKYNEKIEPATPIWIEYYNFPTFIYNTKIAPIIPFGLKGFLWYQGENNTKKPAGYSSLMSLLVKDWRNRWGQGNLPFIYGQLSNFGIRADKPVESNFAVLREEQEKCLSIKNTAMVVNIDLGLADGDVHFKNKQESAKRFANAALGLVYGKKMAYKNPIYKSCAVIGNKIRIRFKNVDKGFITHDKLAPKSFAIAGKDKIFVTAVAKIIGNEIIVWSDRINEPAFVRYAWDANPECNLYSVQGLPLVPFRTDK